MKGALGDDLLVGLVWQGLFHKLALDRDLQQRPSSLKLKPFCSRTRASRKTCRTLWGSGHGFRLEKFLKAKLSYEAYRAKKIKLWLVPSSLS